MLAEDLWTSERSARRIAPIALNGAVENFDEPAHLELIQINLHQTRQYIILAVGRDVDLIKSLML